MFRHSLQRWIQCSSDETPVKSSDSALTLIRNGDRVAASLYPRRLSAVYAGSVLRWSRSAWFDLRFVPLNLGPCLYRVSRGYLWCYGREQSLQADAAGKRRGVDGEGAGHSLPAAADSKRWLGRCFTRGLSTARRAWANRASGLCMRSRSEVKVDAAPRP